MTNLIRLPPTTTMTDLCQHFLTGIFHNTAAECPYCGIDKWKTNYANAMDVNADLRTEIKRLTAERDAYQVAADKLAMENKVLRDRFCDNNCVWTDHHPLCIRYVRSVDTSEKRVQKEAEFVHITEPAAIRAAWESDTDFEGAPV